jgi:hypothetical protein
MHAWTKITAHFTILIGCSNFVGRFCNSFRKLGYDYVTLVIQLIVLVLEVLKTEVACNKLYTFILLKG